MSNVFLSVHKAEEYIRKLKEQTVNQQKVSELYKTFSAYIWALLFEKYILGTKCLGLFLNKHF